MDEEFAKRVAMALVKELRSTEIPSFTFQFHDEGKSYVVNYTASRRGFSNPYGMEVSAGAPGDRCTCCNGTGVRQI